MPCVHIEQREVTEKWKKESGGKWHPCNSSCQACHPSPCFPKSHRLLHWYRNSGIEEEMQSWSPHQSPRSSRPLSAATKPNIRPWSRWAGAALLGLTPGPGRELAVNPEPGPASNYSSSHFYWCYSQTPRSAAPDGFSGQSGGFCGAVWACCQSMLMASLTMGGLSIATPDTVSPALQLNSF